MVDDGNLFHLFVIARNELPIPKFLTKLELVRRGIGISLYLNQSFFYEKS